MSAKCIDQYVKLSVKNSDSGDQEVTMISQNLTKVVDRMFKRCLDDGQFKQVGRWTVYLSNWLNNVYCKVGMYRISGYIRYLVG